MLLHKRRRKWHKQLKGIDKDKKKVPKLKEKSKKLEKEKESSEGNNEFLSQKSEGSIIINKQPKIDEINFLIPRNKEEPKEIRDTEKDKKKAPKFKGKSKKIKKEKESSEENNESLSESNEDNIIINKEVKTEAKVFQPRIKEKIEEIACEENPEDKLYQFYDLRNRYSDDIQINDFTCRINGHSKKSQKFNLEYFFKKFKKTKSIICVAEITSEEEPEKRMNLRLEVKKFDKLKKEEMLQEEDEKEEEEKEEEEEVYNYVKVKTRKDRNIRKFGNKPSYKNTLERNRYSIFGYYYRLNVRNVVLIYENKPNYSLEDFMSQFNEKFILECAAFNTEKFKDKEYAKVFLRFTKIEFYELSQFDLSIQGEEVECLKVVVVDGDKYNYKSFREENEGNEVKYFVVDKKQLVESNESKFLKISKTRKTKRFFVNENKITVEDLLNDPYKVVKKNYRELPEEED